MVECGYCKYDTEKRKVIKRKPLQRLLVDLPDGYQEFYCSNEIKMRRGKGGEYTWFEAECSNHILVKNRGVKC